MNSKTAQVAAQVALYAISVGGYVALSVWGQATAEYVALIGPVLGAAFLMTRLGKQDEVLGRQDEVLGEIKENTNGVLTRRIQEAVTAALEGRAGDDR